jgi:hypothetical protein
MIAVRPLLDLGRSCLLGGKIYESLGFYARAVHLSSNETALLAALETIDIASLPGRFLLLGLASKFPLTKAGKSALPLLKALALPNCQKLELPIVIVAGGCSSDAEAQILSYRSLMLDSFLGFSGTIISGGTVSGISGLVGDLQQIYPRTIHAVGYVPDTKKHLVDTRYKEIRLTCEDEFSTIEPLTYWTDLVSSNVKPNNVKLLGINGGEISAMEFRFALALGASVGIVADSGLEADRLLYDKDWNFSSNLFSLLNDCSCVRSFVFGE